VLPCVVVGAVMAAAGIDRIARPPRAFAAVSVALCGYLAITLARAAPYYLDYFDEASGGAGELAHRRTFEVAWWGEGLDRAVDYVNAHAAPGAVIYRGCIEPQHLAWFREDLWPRMTPDPARAEWIVTYAPSWFPCPLPVEAHQVYEVVHDGAELARVYRRP